MKALEAVEYVLKNPDCTKDQVEKLIPEYKNPLPRRAWLKLFKGALPEKMREKFTDLK